MAIATFGTKGTATQGEIAMWDDSLSNIPSGWAICDGNNGTPNLLGDFPRSVSSTEDPGETGGANSHTLASGQLPSHGHGGSTNSNGSHNHGVDVYWQAGSGTYESADGFDYNTPTTKGGSHSHTASLNNTGSGNAIDNRPSFYQVAYIMKL